MDCVFCKIIKGELPCIKVYEDEYTLAFFSNRPEAPEHTLVIPKKHVRNIFDCPHDTLVNVIKTVQLIAKKHHCVKIIQNNEKPIQEVFHLHFHVIPFIKE